MALAVRPIEFSCRRITTEQGRPGALDAGFHRDNGARPSKKNSKSALDVRNSSFLIRRFARPAELVTKRQHIENHDRKSKPTVLNMKYSLSNLLLAITVIAVAFSWFYDHQRLTAANRQLNDEAAYLIGQVAAAHGSGRVTIPLSMGSRSPIVRTYDFQSVQARSDFLNDLTSPHGIAPQGSQ